MRTGRITQTQVNSCSRLPAALVDPQAMQVATVRTADCCSSRACWTCGDLALETVTAAARRCNQTLRLARPWTLQHWVSLAHYMTGSCGCGGAALPYETAPCMPAGRWKIVLDACSTAACAAATCLAASAACCVAASVASLRDGVPTPLTSLTNHRLNTSVQTRDNANWFLRKRHSDQYSGRELASKPDRLGGATGERGWGKGAPVVVCLHL